MAFQFFIVSVTICRSQCGVEYIVCHNDGGLLHYNSFKDMPRTVQQFIVDHQTNDFVFGCRDCYTLFSDSLPRMQPIYYE